MPIKSKNILKSYFENGDKPNEAQFSDLIDSLVHVNEASTGGAGSGVIDGISTDENGNIVFTFTSGDTINISSNGSVGTVKMPIPYVDSYDNFYFVSKEKGNDKKAFPNSYRFYENIVSASEAARANYDATGNKNMVYVFKGTYNEESVNREHVDLYFEDGAVCWVEGTDTSVINDKLEPINNANVYGKGTFVNKNYDPFDDREGINLRQASSMRIEAKLVDGVQFYQNDVTFVSLSNMSFLYGYAVWYNKNITFKNCKFLNGLTFPGFRNEGGHQIFDNCEFYCPPYTVRDPENNSLDILDYKGDFVLRVVYNGHVRETPKVPFPIEVTGKNRETILKEIYDVFAFERGTPHWHAQISCLSYIEMTNKGGSHGNAKIEIKDSKLIIQKENSFGIILCKRKNSPTEEGNILFNNVIVIDETSGKTSTAIASGWGDTATRQPGLMLNAFSHNCKYDTIKILPELNEWEITFKTIGDFVSKKGGTFEGDVFVSKSGTNEPGIYLGAEGELKTKKLKVTDKIEFEGGMHFDKEGNFYLKSTTGPHWSHIYTPDYRLRRFNEGRGISLQENYVDNNTAFNIKETFDDYKHLDDGVVFFRLTNNRSQIAVGFGDKPYGITGYPGWEINDNFLTPKGYIADLRAKKLRVIDGDAEIGGTVKASEVLVGGQQVATQTWVNAAVAGLIAANTKVSDADKLDGIDSTSFARQEVIPAKTLKIGWYTIAINVGNRASAKFVLRETRSGRHGSIHFYAAHNYGNGNVLTVLSNSSHSSGGAIRNLRIKESGTYDGVVLQAYIDTDDAPVLGYIYEDIQASGWTAKSWISDDVDPGGLKDYSKLTNIAAEIDLDKTQGINSTQEVYVKGTKVHREGTHLDLTNQELRWTENTDAAAIGFKNSGDTDTDSYLYFKTQDNGNEYFKWIHKDVEWMQLKSTGLTTIGDVKANGTYYWGDNKRVIQFSDAWLRLNPSGEFTSGIYCGNKTLRTDGEFQVGSSGSKFKVETNGNTTVYGSFSGKTEKDKYSHLYRFGGIHFTWDSASYGTNAQHSIKSCYGTTFGDSLTMNSFNNIRLNIDSNNNNSNSKFEIGHNTSGVANVLFSVDESGNTVAAGDISAFSDRRLKEALKPVTESFLDKIEKLKPTFYQWKDKSKGSKEQLGFIAQQVKELFPQWVHENKEHYSLSYDKMGAVLAVKGIQELYEEIKKLKLELKEVKYGITN